MGGGGASASCICMGGARTECHGDLGTVSPARLSSAAPLKACLRTHHPPPPARRRVSGDEAHEGDEKGTRARAGRPTGPKQQLWPRRYRPQQTTFFTENPLADPVRRLYQPSSIEKNCLTQHFKAKCLLGGVISEKQGRSRKKGRKGGRVNMSGQAGFWEQNASDVEIKQNGLEEEIKEHRSFSKCHGFKMWILPLFKS